MNINKIENLLKTISQLMREDSCTDEEYLIFVANLLNAFGQSGLINEQKFSEVNTKDAFNVELALNQNPNDPHLAAILQSHVIIKWSESFKDDG